MPPADPGDDAPSDSRDDEPAGSSDEPSDSGHAPAGSGDAPSDSGHAPFGHDDAEPSDAGGSPSSSGDDEPSGSSHATESGDADRSTDAPPTDASSPEATGDDVGGSSPDGSRSEGSPPDGPGPNEQYCSSCGDIVARAAERCPHCGVPKQGTAPAPDDEYGTASTADVEYETDRSTAAILALAVGGLGVHKFYIGKTGQGMLYLCFFWTLIPMLVAFVEGVIYLSESDEEFQRKHVP